MASSFAISTAPAQYELFEQVLDFAPGAATTLHQHLSQSYVTVIEGQITFSQEGKETVYNRGQGFTEAAGAFHALTNKGSSKARIFITVLASPGQPQALAHPAGSAPAIPPTVVASGRQMLGTQPAEFTLTQSVVDFGPGAFQPPHHHGGDGLVMVTDGEVVFAAAGREHRLKPGQSFPDIGDPHTALNVAPGTSTTVVTFLIKKGEPQTTFLTTAAPSAPATGVLPPSTGSGGLRSR
jgi:quercetin dioxygenase-like cupin family protein